MIPAFLALALTTPMPQQQPLVQNTGARRIPAGVVAIAWDDVGREWISASRPDGEPSHLPTLDHLAEVGLTFENFYGAQACSPQRAQVMTGLYGFRAGNLVGQVIQPQHGDLWSMPTAAALPHVLQGKKSAIGKWHLDQPSRLMHPIECGFNDAWVTQFNLGGDGSYYDCDQVLHNGQPAFAAGYLPHRCALRAIKRIKAGDSFVYVPLHLAHKPIEAPPPTMHTYGDLTGASDEQVALAMIEAADHLTGLIATAALQSGYVVVVYSDNGNSGLFGGDKGSLTEGGTRTWMVVAGPTIRKGTTWQLVQSTDLYATIAELVNHDPLPDPPIDSVSFVPLLRSSTVGLREWVYTEEFKPNGTAPTAWDRTMRDERWKAWFLADGGRELYDLLEDPNEEHDLLLDGESSEEQAAMDWLEERLPS